jgi:hypothetical protein
VTTPVSGVKRLETGGRFAACSRTLDGIVSTDAWRELPAVDEIITTTGFRLDLSISANLRLELDTSVECPVRLAPLIDPNQHSPGTVYPHGAAELLHPEADNETVGMKSYGRADVSAAHGLRAAAVGRGGDRLRLGGGAPPRGRPARGGRLLDRRR